MGLLAAIDSYNPVSGMELKTYAPQIKDVDVAKETTQGQIDALVKSDNPLMQRAAAVGKMGAASRGLLNSSLAQEAAMNAVLDKATEIGKADAEIYNNRAIANQGAMNESLQFNAGE